MKFSIQEDEENAIVSRLDAEDSYEHKRQSALEFLGEKWVLHPNYDPASHPQHNVRVTA